MVFVSYQRADREMVQRLVHAVAAAGIDVWWDALLIGGVRFGPEIERRLAEAELVVVCWGAGAAASDWVRDEADVARERGTLFSLTIDPSAQIPLGFRGFHTIAWDGDDRRLPEVVQQIAARLGEPAATAEPAPVGETAPPLAPAGSSSW